jgi:hydroxymethylpyrimidine kinase/phosphomethylpyrimidine kinase/thiamine-phosphate diphosphorylase
MTLLIIAGSESNGFAGCVRDLAVAHSLGADAQLVLTCVTAQTGTGILACESLSPDLLRAQLSSLQVTPAVIKIGLLTQHAQAETLAHWLSTLTNPPFVILDPIRNSSGEDKPFSQESFVDMLSPLFPCVSLITPNLLELRALTGAPSDHSEHDCATTFFQLFPKFSGDILLTGGHADDLANSATVIDRLYRRCDQAKTVKANQVAQWQQTKHARPLRGTGCRLSTTIACAVEKNYTMLDAITLANASLQRRLKLPVDESTTEPFGWSKDIRDFANVSRDRIIKTPKHPFARMRKTKGIYPVVDSSAWITRLAMTGIKTIQLRLKNCPTKLLRDEIAEAIYVARHYDLQLFINDHWQLAIELGAYGVHLGQEDLIDADLTAIQQAGLRLGVSTHGDFELCAALQLRPSYMAVGAVFPTQTKDMSGKIQGLERLQRYCELSPEIPVVAIGGINEKNIESVLAQGVNIVAVVSAITQADKPEQQCRTLDALCQHRPRLTMTP